MKNILSFFILASILFVANPVHAFTSDEALSSIQQWRKDNKLPQYKVNKNLCKFAQLRVGEIQEDWRHDGLTRAYKYDESMIAVGENLARRFSTPSAMMKGWQESPSHLKNLKRDFTDTCVVCENNYCAHIFGKPAKRTLFSFILY